MSKIRILVVIVTITPLVSFCQKIKQHTYDAIRVCLEGTQKGEKFPYVLGTELLGYSHRLADFDGNFNTAFFQSLSLKNSAVKTGDSVFLQSDILYMKERMKKAVGTSRLKGRKLRKLGVSFTDTITEQQLLDPRPTIFRLCEPLFSKDGRTALIYLETTCQGDCGSGDYYIVRKRGKEWVLLGTVNIWVS